ncbi:hypothetical protein EI94DRAFT_784774 [Lactarius quietus]|nr:hypothetical protein EI94DRAFT_784774 [Lactarius quietus]
MPRPTLKGETSSIRQTISVLSPPLSAVYMILLFQHSQDHAFEAFIGERVRSVEPATSSLSQPRVNYQETVSGSFPSLEKLRTSYLTTYNESTYSTLMGLPHLGGRGGELAPGSGCPDYLGGSQDEQVRQDHGKTPSTRVASQFSAGPLNRMSNGWCAMGVLRLLLETSSAAERPA